MQIGRGDDAFDLAGRRYGDGRRLRQGDVSLGISGLWRLNNALVK